MSTANDKLTEKHRSFIEAQQMFFVATAAPDGRVNLSPKGLDSLKILSDDRILWLNLSGSGNETAAHLREHPRMTLMFCAFEGDAQVLRLYGKAKVVHPRDPEWQEVSQHFTLHPGSRQIFDLTIDMAQVSCGSGVPFMTYESQRGIDEMLPFYDKMGEEKLQKYWSIKNTKSIDGKDTGIFG